MATEPKTRAPKRTPVDNLTKHVLVLLPQIMAATPKGTPVRERVRLAYEAAAELEATQRELVTAWHNDESTAWAVEFWSKYEGIR